MKRIFTHESPSRTRDIGLLVLRIAVASLLITHGLPKFQKIISGDPIAFSSVMGMSPELSMTMAMLAEFFCSILVIFGFATRIAAVPIIILMTIISFSVHANDPIGTKELPLLYLSGFFIIFLMGAGRYSLDFLIHKRLQKARV